MKIPLAILLSFTLLLAACGDDDDAADAGGTTSTDSEEPDANDTRADDPEQDSDAESEAPAVEEAATPTTAAEASAPTPAAQGGGTFSLYDFRYCEILMTVTDEGGNEVTEVWGTPGVDPCTDEAWYALDPVAIQAENDATFIDMNGPRAFIVDGSADTGDGTGGTGTAAGGEAVTRQFGDITMTLLATTEVTDESIAYVPDLVVRTTTWTFQAGTEIYELTDPDGFVYIMQSYSQIVDRSLTAADLPTLGERLELPEGWTYSSRVLDEPLQVALSPDGAFVVQDDLRNSYQRNG